MTHKKFMEQLIRDFIVVVYGQNAAAARGTVYERPSTPATQLNRSEVKHSIHWTARKHAVDISSKYEMNRTQYSSSKHVLYYVLSC
jgi:hypothetical protein